MWLAVPLPSLCVHSNGVGVLSQDVCPCDGGVGRRDRPLADCHERTEVSPRLWW